MKKLTVTAILLALIMGWSLTGCGQTASETADTAANTAITAELETTEDTADASESSEETAAASESAAVSVSNVTEPSAAANSFTGNSAGLIDSTALFSDRDLEQSADLSEAQYLTVSDSETLEITEAGVYVLSGTAADCTVLVDADETAKVQLVLNGVSITNSDCPAIYVVSADKVFVTSAGENTLSVTGSFRADGETNTDAVIFSKSDLVLNGTGTLNITSAQGNGITSKDDLKVTGGTYTLSTALDALEANDSLSVCGGSFTINTDKDGLHCENDELEGAIYIADGSFTINAASDGIQANAVLQIDGGTFDITASEGLEATYVQLNGGTISISASDDGINASANTSAYEVAIEINGGDLTIVMGQGDTDAIDANGSIYVNGGTIDITAPTSSFDYDRTAEYNGGTIIINGEQADEIPAEMMGGMGGFGGRGGRA